jgi:hypothetical protein
MISTSSGTVILETVKISFKAVEGRETRVWFLLAVGLGNRMDNKDLECLDIGESYHLIPRFLGRVD